MQRKFIFGIGIFTFLLLGLSYLISNSDRMSNMQVEWNSSGEWIVFSCGVSSISNPSSILYIVRPDGSELQAITNSKFIANSPTWSSDGNWIAFSSEGSLFKVRPDGTEIQEIVHSSSIGAIGHVDWSSSGDWIAFSTQGLGNNSIYKVSSDGSDLQKIASNAENLGDPKWSPDDSMIAFRISTASESSGIYIISTADNEVSRILEHPQIIGGLDWSLDMDMLLVTLGFEPYSLQLDDSTLEMVKLDAYWDTPAWSPDGEWIAFSGNTEDTPTNNQIYKSQIDGTELQQLTDLTDCFPTSPQWHNFGNPDS